MPETAVLAPGTPVWVDLGSPDVDASKKFYAGLFGWEARVDPNPDFGGYVTFSKDGKSVCGAAPLMAPDQPPAFTTYIGVESARDTAARATQAGATVLVEPMDVGEHGTMAIVQDPTGAVFGLWEPKAMAGFAAYDEPNTVCWNELATRDIDRAIEFYRTVFGYGVKDEKTDFGRYIEWQVDGRSVGGGMPLSEGLPESIPAHWLTYFAVTNLSESTATVEKLGGRVMSGPIDTPQGPFCVISDPQGATFAIIQMSANS